MTYIYKCPKCDKEQEVSHSVNEVPIIDCDNCETPMRKKIIPTPIKFKGGGFYVNE